jgi:DNA polymerase elongation subunit (family B)
VQVPLNIFLFQDRVFNVSEDGKMDILEPPHVPRYDIVESKGTPTFVVGRGWKNVTRRMLPVREWITQCERYPFGYMTHLCTTQPEFMTKHAWKRNPRIMYLDIEVASDGSGLFPKAERNPVAMIGYKMDTSNIVTILDNYEPKNEGKEDEQILKEFIEALKTINPDIITTYNGWKFDIPYIKTRFQKCGIEHNILYWGVSNPIPNTMTKLVAMTHSDRSMSNLISRLSYDIYAVDVIKDQKLMGLENKKMKTLAKHFLSDKESESIIELETGIKNIKAMMASKNGKSELKEYLTSDVNITERLANVYMGQNIEFAQRLNVPLGMILSRTSGMIATLHMLKQMLKSDIIAIDRNADRYKELYRISRANGHKKDFQGAVVDIMKTGKIKKLKKFDFSGLYPNIIRSLNLSYETVKFDPELDVMPYREETIINTDKEKNELVLGIPDSVLNRTIVIHIDMSERGMVPKMLDDLINMRDNIKKEMKTLDNREAKRKLDTQQWFLKVCANSAYGILSNRFTIGYLPIGITITGMGRYLVTEAMKFLQREAGQECIVEIDTDGIISTADMPVSKLNEFITNLMKDKFGLETSTLELEEEEFEAGYFYKMKNYIVKEKNGDVIKHGAYFKSSKACTAYRRAVDLIVDYAIRESITSEECRIKSLDFSELKIDDFMQSQRMSKNKDEYGMTSGRIQSLSDGNNFDMHATTTYADRVAASSSSLVVNLAEKYERMFGFTPMAGDVLEYVVVMSPITGKKEYEPFNVHDPSQLGRIDKQYYSEMIERMLGGLLNTTSEGQDTLELADIWDVSGTIQQGE